jgi:hypothetical protein
MGLSAKADIRPTVKGRHVAWWDSQPVEGLPPEARLRLVCFNDAVLFVGTTGELAEKVAAWRGEHQDGTDPTEATQDLLTRLDPKQVRVPKDREGRPILPPR